MKKWLSGILIFILFVLLACVRLFESELFYDPLITFFKGNYTQQAPPDFKTGRLLVFTSFRYFLNSGFSLLILWLAFKDAAIMKFSGMIYAVVFVAGILLFWFLVEKMNTENYFFLFYVRRFLIQPLLILILLPAFYYQKSMKKAG